ncbi:hypothetical protein E2562_006768, partial [Oryza meyeriana var. granulata]
MRSLRVTRKPSSTSPFHCRPAAIADHRGGLLDAEDPRRDAIVTIAADAIFLRNTSLLTERR